MFRLSFDQQTSGIFRLTYDQYMFLVSDHLPFDHETYREHATLVEHKESNNTWQQDNFLYLAVYQNQQQWPFLIVTQRYEPGPDAGFVPGMLILPETSLLFIGAGERLLAYRLNPPIMLWEDRADTGFWEWKRYRDVIIMSAELELAVWDRRGKKLWTTFVEPPWNYSLDENTIHVEVMGAKASFPLLKGPATTSRWW